MMEKNLYEKNFEGAFDEDTACWFIVEKRHEKEFVEGIAKRLIGDGCRNFDFVGKYAQEWENIFDDVDIGLKPDLTEDNVALTMAWKSRADIVKAMSCSCKERQYVFYDDEHSCETVLHMREEDK